LIIVYHQNARIINVKSINDQKIEFDCKKNIASGLQDIAKQFPNEKIVWCSSSVKEQLNLEEIKTLFHHNKMMLSFSSSQHNFFDSRIGYVDESLFINVNKKVYYPTWQMSSVAGVIHAAVLNALKDKIVCDSDFDYYLNSIAKLAMPLGLLCYSSPRLLKNGEFENTTKASLYQLFRFVKQHYKTRWVFLLLLNIGLYERKFPIWPFLLSLFYDYRLNTNINLDTIKVQSSLNIIGETTVDVIIPTIGRKGYLFDVLKDFSKQTFLPNKIIIVEQNPQEGSKTELDYIHDENWPFAIEHIFLHQAGVCNARNLALNNAESEWVFLADDDNRFEPDLIQEIFQNIKQFGSEVVTTSYPQLNEYKKYRKVIQWPTFGAGNSFVRRNLLDKVRFNSALEFGYGEDADFGMQLRNKGYDVLYLPKPEIIHLKAPIGGFRTKPVLLWQNDLIQPKPSPTVMLYIISHNTQEQLKGYKTTLFFKFYKHQNIKNPYNYFKMFQKQWNQSVLWANQLKKS
jgi:glycosyltransferase involved in cell wall biosynthesis